MNNFGRVVEIKTANMSFSYSDFTMEFTIPFDNSPLPNESELKIYNLSNSTIQKIERGKVLLVNAGYKGDVGVILHGLISKVSSKSDGVDRVTTIHVLDTGELEKKKISKAYANGTMASYILKEMAAALSLPLAQFQLVKDVRYEEGYTASGTVTEIIKKVADECDTTAFINKGKLYIRNLKIGADAIFNLAPETGLIGSPEAYEDEKSKGLNLNSQLQYRITTASVIHLKSKLYTGTLHISKGTHKCSSSDFTTEMEGIFP